MGNKVFKLPAYPEAKREHLTKPAQPNDNDRQKNANCYTELILLMTADTCAAECKSELPSVLPDWGGARPI